MRPSRWIGLGAAFGFAAVALGAFGAHGLKGRIPPERLAVLETGARYALVHALALVAVGILAEREDARLLRVSGRAFAAGLALFSGSLVALAVSGIKAFGAVTPFGGALLLAGWACLASHAWRSSRRSG